MKADAADFGLETHPNEVSFLAGGGRLGALMRALDWSSTSLGPPQSWPQSLRSAVGICLGANFPIAIYWGRELALLYNDAWSSIPGGKHPWALGRPGREVWPEIWNEIGPLYETVQTSGEGIWQQDQLLPMHRHGYTEECYFNFTFSPIRGEDGKVEGIFNAVVETTYRVISERRERTLRELAERLSAARSEEEVYGLAAQVLAAGSADAPFCLFYRIEEGGAQLANAAGAAADGLERFREIGLRDPAAPWPLGRVIETGRAEVGDAQSLRGGPWPEPVTSVLIVPIAVTAQLGQSAAAFVAGISPRRALDEDYRNFFGRAASHIATAIANVHAYEEERRRAEALAEIDRAKTTFFSNVSHEFRTPLTLMLGPIEDVLAKPSEEVLPDNRVLIEVAHRNGLRLLKLVNSLLDFACIEAGRMQASFVRTDLARLTIDLASNFRSATERAGLALVVACPPLPEPVFVDREMWEKVILNLLSNAFKFTFEGAISIELGHREGTAVLTVRDTGTGIPADQLPLLFKRFHRIEGARGRSFEGSGIGLALVQELIQLHGGTIRVQREQGRGTAFIVSIPFGTAHLPQDRIGAGRALSSSAVRAHAYVEEALRWLPDAGSSGTPAASSVHAGLSPGARSRVLLADDNADMRDYVIRLLRGRHEIEAVSDGQAALDAARKRPADLIITDVMMPRLDGFGLLRAVREDPDLRELPVILLSARAGEESIIEGHAAGADDYLVKPFSARELIARVEAALARSQLRREASEALMESEARFRNMADCTPVMMWITDPAGACTYLNRRWYEFTGQAPAHALGFGWLEATHPADRPEAERKFRDANARREAFRLEYRLLRADGEYRWAIDAASPRFGANSEFLGYIGSVIDITERKRAESMQAAQRRALELAIENAPLTDVFDALIRSVETQTESRMLGSILLLDKNGVHLRHGAAPSLPDEYNAAIDGIAIGPCAGSCGTAAFTRQPVYVADVASDPLWADFRELAQAHGLRACWSTPIISARGEVLATFALYYNEPREPSAADLQLIAVATRTAALVIERRRAEDALRDLNETLEERINEAIAQREAAEEQLRQAQKMEAIGHLTGGVAHDFNNLLTIVIGNIETLQRHLPKESPDRLRRSADNAMQGARRAVTLTQHLLAFSRRQPLDPKPTDVNKLVASMSHILTRTLGERIDVETVLAGGVWRIEVDPNQLENALLNLALNARDAMAGGGKLTIETANAHLDEGYSARLAEVVPGQYVVLAVSDTGSGMSKEALERAFEPFFTTKPTGHGTGLGLSQVYGFVKQSGGHVKLYSERRQGTTVKIYLPRFAGAEVDEDIVSETLPEGARAGTILVVEDDDGVRTHTSEILRELGYRVIEANDGAAALRQLEREGSIDLLFTDVGLPGINGRELADEARKRRPGLKVLFTTGYARNAIVHHGRLNPGVQLIGKPFTYNELAAKVRDIIDGTPLER